MPDTHVDNLKVEVSGTPGTGTATIGSAASGCRGFVAGDDGKTFSGRWTDGTAWETATGCAYTHSGTTLARGTLLASSTGSRLSLTSAAVFECSPVADLGNRVEQIALQDVTITDAAVTMQVGKRYRGSIAAFTADRTYTLPAVFAAGDMVEVCITEGDDTYELLVTAASGDTLNGVAGGTEWSRVFITGEVVRFRGDVANSAWVVDYDGRIPQKGIVRVTTAGTTNTGASLTSPSAMGGYAGTADLAVGCTVSTANFTITSRRGGTKIDLQFFWLSNASVTTATESLVNLIRNSSVSVTQFRVVGGATNLAGLSGSGSVLGVVDEVFGLQIRTSGTNNTGCALGTFLAMTEVLR